MLLGYKYPDDSNWSENERHVWVSQDKKLPQVVIIMF